MKKITIALILFLLVSIVAEAQVSATTKKPETKRPINTLPVTAILGAFGDEVNILVEKVQQKKVNTVQGIRFTRGILNGRKVVIALTGIGKVNAAITTTLMLDHFKPKEVIFTGIAGGVNPELSPGDIVIGTLVAFHDYGTITPDSMLVRPTKNPASIVENPAFFPADPNLVMLAEQAGKNTQFEIIPGHNTSLPKIIKGTIVTGDVFISSMAATQLLRKKMNADATEMEGAAVAQACWQQQVPFIVIRSLSDNAGNNAYNDAKKFYSVAARNSASLVLAIINLIEKRH